MLVLQTHPVGQAPRRRRLPRPVAVGLVVLALLAAGAGWYGGVGLLTGEEAPLPLVVTDAPSPGELPDGSVPEDAPPGAGEDGPGAGEDGPGADGLGGAAPAVPVLGP